jgi:hypothetical protein
MLINRITNRMVTLGFALMSHDNEVMTHFSDI